MNSQSNQEQGFTVTIDHSSTTPPYEQIIDSVVAAVSEGRLATGMKLPTVRGLAAELDLAVNTVAKAYRQLESEGHVHTEGRKGTIVQSRGDNSDDLTSLLQDVCTTAQRHRLSLDETIGALRQTWTQETTSA